MTQLRLPHVDPPPPTRIDRAIAAAARAKARTAARNAEPDRGRMPPLTVVYLFVGDRAGGSYGYPRTVIATGHGGAPLGCSVLGCCEPATFHRPALRYVCFDHRRGPLGLPVLEEQRLAWVERSMGVG